MPNSFINGTFNVDLSYNYITASAQCINVVNCVTTDAPATAHIGADMLGVLGANTPRKEAQWARCTQKSLDPNFLFKYNTS